MRQGPPSDPADAFAAPNYAFWNAPSQRVDQTQGAPITRLMQAIHAARPDLQEAFPLSNAAGRRDFHAWFVAHGVREYRTGDAPLAAALCESSVRTQTIDRYLARIRLSFSRASGRQAGT
jgi:hypothetical protein